MAEQVQANELMTLIFSQRHALCTLQESALDDSEEIRSQMGTLPSDNGKNVVHGLFGNPRPQETRGAKAGVNGPTALLRRLHAENPGASPKEALAFCLGINPEINRSSVQSIWWTMQSKARTTKAA
jgi:hypothetical protein